jgi:hypothetical protein
LPVVAGGVESREGAGYTESRAPRGFGQRVFNEHVSCPQSTSWSAAPMAHVKLRP